MVGVRGDLALDTRGGVREPWNARKSKAYLDPRKQPEGQCPGFVGVLAACAIGPILGDVAVAEFDTTVPDASGPGGVDEPGRPVQGDPVDWARHRSGRRLSKGSKISA